MRYRIEVTHIPSSLFGRQAPEPLAEPRWFHRFRSRTGRDRYLYGDVPEVVLYDEWRHSVDPVTWTSRDKAEDAASRLRARGYLVKIREV